MLAGGCKPGHRPIMFKGATPPHRQPPNFLGFHRLPRSLPACLPARLPSGLPAFRPAFRPPACPPTHTPARPRARAPARANTHARKNTKPWSRDRYGPDGKSVMGRLKSRPGRFFGREALQASDCQCLCSGNSSVAEPLKPFLQR